MRQHPRHYTTPVSVPVHYGNLEDKGRRDTREYTEDAVAARWPRLQRRRKKPRGEQGSSSRKRAVRQKCTARPASTARSI